MLDTGTGWVYLLHFTDPVTGEHARFGHAGHYVGWALHLQSRLDHHGTVSGARLMFHVKQAGIGWELARVWQGSKQRERALKNQGGHSRKCPLCGIRLNAPQAAEIERLMASALAA